MCFVQNIQSVLLLKLVLIDAISLIFFIIFLLQLKDSCMLWG